MRTKTISAADAHTIEQLADDPATTAEQVCEAAIDEHDQALISSVRINRRGCKGHMTAGARQAISEAVAKIRAAYGKGR